MKNNPLVSILITNYNGEKYIKRCLNSCNSQTYKNKEIIFFDDASEDNSINQVLKFKKVVLIKNKKRKYNYGSFNQINGLEKAFKISKGEVICLLDSDDFFKKNKISKIVNFFKKNKKKNFVNDNPIFYYNKNKQILSSSLKRKIESGSIWPRFNQTSCMSMRRRFFKQALKSTSFKKFNNIWIDFRIATFAYFVKKDFNILNNNLTYYFQRPGNISSKFNKLSKNWWLRRNEAHMYMKFYLKKENLKFKHGLDYMITKSLKFFYK